MFLETERLLLRRIQEEDFPDFCAYAMDEEMCRLMGNAPLVTEADARITFDWLKDNEERGYAIVLKETGRMIGNLTVTPVHAHLLDQAAQADLAGKEGRGMSFCLARRCWRQGLMSEAVQAVIAHLFQEEGFDYVQCGYFTFNEASRKFQEKLGFTHLTTITVDYYGEEIVTVENVLWNEAKQ